MKYQIYAFVMLVTVITFASSQSVSEASVSIINGSGHVANVDRTLIGFTGIEIDVDANVTVMLRDSSHLIIHSGDNLIASFHTEFHQGTLMISMPYVALDLCNLAQGEVVESCDIVSNDVRQLYICCSHQTKQDQS